LTLFDFFNTVAIENLTGINTYKFFNKQSRGIIIQFRDMWKNSIHSNKCINKKKSQDIDNKNF